MSNSTPSKHLDTLLDSMTLAEKIGQMTLISANLAVTGPKVSGDYLAAIRAGQVGTVSVLWGAAQTTAVQRIAVEETRLGIPLLFALDVIHGHHTVFPIPLAEAAAFDPALWERTGRIAAVEAAADGVNFNYAPMVDVARDPRWGRIAEGPGEDPWLAVRFAQAKVKGFQGDDLAAPDALAACAKHLAAYGAATAGRDYASVDIAERTFHEVYLPPFKAAVERGVRAIMPGFHDLAGVPMTANRAVLQDLVRERWGFAGVMISDYNAITELLQHGVAGDLAEAAALALQAGVDIDLMGDAYARGLPGALERKLVTMAQIDQAVRRILALKAELGLFDTPYSRGASPLGATQVEAHRKAARDCARRSIVLLRNEGGLLPVATPPRKVAVLGPLADAPAEMRGPWAFVGQPEDMVPILAGLQAAWPESEIRHAKGVEITAAEPADLDGAVALADWADLVVLCLGEYAEMSGEAASRARLDLPGRQAELARAVLARGKPAIVLLTAGRPLAVPWLFEQADCVLATWFLGSEAGHAIADVLTGRHNPSGRLPVSWPMGEGQIPIHYGPRPTGRPTDYGQKYTSKYLDLPVEPQFPFGHGLSYTRFSLAELQASPATVAPDGTITVTAEVANEGGRVGEATLLLFARDPVASLARPLLELKGIAKATLAPGARTTVTFTLPAAELAFLGEDLQPRLEPGAIELSVGQSADRNALLTTTIQIADRG
jgi:beta-glucosidase